MTLPSMSFQRATLILLIEGFVSVSLQMIALRQIVPFAGSSVPVTCLVITGFLAALAMGYRAGGHIRKNIEKKLESNLVFVALFVGLGLSYAAAGLLFPSALLIFPHPLIAVGLYVVVIVMPIVYLLSTTVILLINFREAAHAAGQAADTFNVSTWGNVLGGLVTTLLLMYYLGIGWAVTINAMLLLLAYTLIPSDSIVKKVAISVPIALAAGVINIGFERFAFDRTTAFANYRTIAMADGSSSLHINDSNASRNNDQDKGHQYIEYFEDQAFTPSRSYDRRNILILGAGGFTFGRGRELQGARITFVDVDSALSDIGQDFLGEEIDGQFVVSDARAYLLGSTQLYDLIVLDTFSHLQSVPAHLVTLEFFQLLHSRLASNGRLFVNVIAKQDGPDRFRRGFDNTIRAAFSKCSTHIISRPMIPVVNVLYQCTVSYDDLNATIYRDDNTRSSVDSLFR